MRIGLVSAAYPPDLDGIGDYTWWMARTLAISDHVESPVIVFTRDGSDHKASQGVKVSKFFDPHRAKTFFRLSASVEREDSDHERPLDWLVLQYNPFSWGRRGYCPSVPSTLRRFRQSGSTTRLAVMFHETTIPKWPWRFSLMFTWQYPIFRNVCRVADMAFVSTTRWIPQVRRAAKGLPIHHLPVGSNIPLRDVSRDEARMKLGIEPDAIVLGVFGGAHISRRLDWIAATVAEAKRTQPGRRIALLYIGPEGGAMRRALGDSDLIDCGALLPEEVGCRVRALDAAISPFLDGVSTRRGSVMAFLQHGIPIATNQSLWTDELFRKATPPGILVSSARSAVAFAAETAGWLDRRLTGKVPDFEVTDFFDRNLTWRIIADIMVGHLWR